MTLITLIILSIALSMDCFAVCIACGTKNISAKDSVKMSISFAFFHVLMIGGGWLLGYGFMKYISFFDHWLAFGLLSAIGFKMVFETYKEDDKGRFFISSWPVLLGLSLATSIDAFVVGISLSLENVNIMEACSCIAIVLLLCSFTGLFIGKKLKKLNSRYASLLGGIVLILIGIKILLEHEYQIYLF